MKVLISTLAIVAAFALPAEAQLSLKIEEGKVTLDAVNVPTRQILAEWARIGGTKVVGADKITGAPLTLKLAGVPENQALDIILRNVAGFMAAPRRVSAAPGASQYDRILIMATSSAPSGGPNAAARGGAAPGNIGAAMNGTQRRVPPRPPNLPPAVGDDPPVEDDQQVIMEDDQADTGINQPPVFTFPSPGAPGNGPVFTPMPGNAQQPISLQPGPNGPTIYNFQPADGQVPAQPAPTGSFGVVGAPTPGMIQMPTQPPPNTRPPTPTRPPGSE